MSRATIFLIVILSGMLVGLLLFSNRRSDTTGNPPPAVVETKPIDNSSAAAPAPGPAVRVEPPVTTPPRVSVPSTQRTASATTAAVPKPGTVLIEPDTDPDPETKPLPVLERDYGATTNRDTRLDLMMDIAEVSSPDAVRALTRLFELETDPELKVDLLDSLLGIDGQKDEKLIMLTLGIRPGLPGEVRQSAIDGLIDLEDMRAIPLLNGLLNDPDAEIREAAQDALELLQDPAPTLK